MIGEARVSLPFGFNELECGLLFALFAFVGIVLWLAIRKSGGNGPRWGE